MSTHDPGILLSPRLCLGCSNWEPPPAATSPAKEGLTRPHVVLRFSLSSHSRTSFSSLSIGNPVPEVQTPISVSFCNSLGTRRNIYLSGLRVARS